MDHHLNAVPWDVSELVLFPDQLAETLGIPPSLTDVGAGSGPLVGLAGFQLCNLNNKGYLSMSLENFKYPPGCSFIEEISLVSPYRPGGSISPVSEFNFETEFYNLASSQHNVIDMEHIDLDFEKNVNIIKGENHNQITKQPVMECTSRFTSQDMADPLMVMDLLKQLGSEDIKSDLDFINGLGLLNDNLFLPSDSEPKVEPATTELQTQIPVPLAELISTIPSENEEPFQVDSFFAVSSNLQPEDESDALIVDCGVSDDSISQYEPKNDVSKFIVGGFLPSNGITSQSPISVLSGFQVVSSDSLSKSQSPVSASYSFQVVSNDSLSSSESSDLNDPYKQSTLNYKPEKRMRKKEQNKTAALKYRQRKRQEQDTFFNECSEIERKNSLLRQRADEITKEINYLKGLLMEISTANL